MLNDSHDDSVKFYGIVLDGCNKNGRVSNERREDDKEIISCPGIPQSIIFNAIFSFIAELVIKNGHSDRNLCETGKVMKGNGRRADGEGHGT